MVAPAYMATDTEFLNFCISECLEAGRFFALGGKAPRKSC